MSRPLLSSLLLALILLNSSYAQSQDVRELYAKGKDAYEKQDYENYYNNLVAANKVHPYQQVILYHLGIASALTGRKEKAITCLEKAIYINSSFDLQRDDFLVIKNDPDFIRIVELQNELAQPIISSKLAFTISDKRAHVEAIAHDNTSNTFYLGAIHTRKIIKRDENGTLTNFTKPGEYGLTSVFSIKIDAQKKVLWACSSPMPEMENYDSTIRSAVFQFNLRDGKLLKKFETSNSILGNIFGDLCLNDKGEVFVSDSKNNIIFKVNEETGMLEEFYTSKEFWNIQGITFSDDNLFMFISDYIKGPYRLRLDNMELIKLESRFDESLKGIDGMVFYNNSLIAIQNGVTPARVSRYSLSQSMDVLTQVDILDRGHPMFNEPTTGTLVNGSFYYVANSPWGFYDADHHLQEKELEDLVILVNSLR